MKRIVNLLAKVLPVAMLSLGSLQGGAVEIEKGVSLALAQYRALHISDLRYSLSIMVPDDIAKPVSFYEDLRFNWNGSGDLQLDFQGSEDQFDGIFMVNGKRVNLVLHDEHIIIPERYLNVGQNRIIVEGDCGDKALNRHEDYLYTLFVPDHARSVFPCFDQPDLKARFSLDLELPEGWVSLTNDTEHPIPTYLFSFTAGKFQVQTTTRDGRELTAFYRETDPQKVAQLPTVFDQAALSLRWMEQYTAIPYPFEKYAFVVLPGYQFGGMEHPGCIHFTDHEIFLGPNPSPDELMTRLNLIAHETAHMWFGDLVTMRWFDDVWTKEVFANFMADKIAREQFPEVDHDLAFVKAHYPQALSTDRTLGSHAIQQPLNNLNQAGLLYGNIIYHKAPIMMRKLEQEKGAITLKRGLRTYLLNYSYGNASWDELVEVLDLFEPEHSARAFSDVWVKQRGLPTVSCQSRGDSSLLVTQEDPYHRGLTWSQSLDIAFASPSDAAKLSSQRLYMDAAAIVVTPPAGGRVPVLNSTGDGYGRFVLDSAAIPVLAESWKTMPDALHRYAAVINLMENFHLGNIEADRLLDIFITQLQHERDALIASTLCNDINTLCGLIDAYQREQAERRLWDMAQEHELPSVRQSLLRNLSLTATSPDIVAGIHDLWSSMSSPLLAPRDYARMAYHLAIMMPDQWQHIVAKQRGRLVTDDERREFDFVSRACNPDVEVQARLFAELLQPQNRRVEPWARAMLTLLNDPVREPFSNRYLVPGLDALEDVQRTGDIFFPGYWLSSLLSGHRSPEASEIVKSWIEAHPELPTPLMNKLLENSYWLLRR